MTRNSIRRRRGISLAEILAVVVIVGVLAAMIIPRFAGQSNNAKRNACFVNKGNIEVQVQLWYRNKGQLPAGDLSDISSDGNYFPDKLPVCPVDGSSYRIDSSSGQVVGHSH